MDLYAEALNRFQTLFDKAKRLKLNEPTAMTLATVDADGVPFARTLLLKKADEDGFVFYTNLNSDKGRQLSTNNRAALCFFWDPLMEQVRVQGEVKPVSDEEADTYWKSRPRMHQLASLASRQSRPLSDARELDIQVMQQTMIYLGRKVPRPKHWSGYRLKPFRIEFWKSGKFRLNSRECYSLDSGVWTKTFLYP